MGFAIDKTNISENNGTINIVVNKLGDTVLTTKVNLTRSYNTTGMSYNYKLHVHVVLKNVINFCTYRNDGLQHQFWPITI